MYFDDVLLELGVVLYTRLLFVESRLFGCKIKILDVNVPRQVR